MCARPRGGLSHAAFLHAEIAFCRFGRGRRRLPLRRGGGAVMDALPLAQDGFGPEADWLPCGLLLTDPDGQILAASGKGVDDGLGVVVDPGAAVATGHDNAGR